MNHTMCNGLTEEILQNLVTLHVAARYLIALFRTGLLPWTNVEINEAPIGTCQQS